MASVLLEEQIPTFHFAFPRYCLQKTISHSKTTKEKTMEEYKRRTCIVVQQLNNVFDKLTTRESSRFPPNSLSIPLKWRHFMGRFIYSSSFWQLIFVTGYFFCRIAPEFNSKLSFLNWVFFRVWNLHTRRHQMWRSIQMVFMLYPILILFMVASNHLSVANLFFSAVPKITSFKTRWNLIRLLVFSPKTHLSASCIFGIRFVLFVLLGCQTGSLLRHRIL